MKSIAERKADAAALIAVARQAGIAVEADEFGRGTFLFSSVETLARLLDAAKAVAAPEKPQQATAAQAEQARPLTDEQIERLGHEVIGTWCTLAPDSNLMRFARAIERAHGIGTEGGTKS